MLLNELCVEFTWSHVLGVPGSREGSPQASSTPQAILEGRQQLPDDYWKEFVRVPYLAVIIFSVG